MSTEKTPLVLLQDCSEIRAHSNSTCDLGHENKAVCYLTLCVCDFFDSNIFSLIPADIVQRQLGCSRSSGIKRQSSPLKAASVRHLLFRPARSWANAFAI